MGRSLKKERRNQVVFQTEGYMVRQRTTSWSVKGVKAETEGRQFSIHEMEPMKWRANWTFTTGKRKRVEVHAETFELAVKLASEKLFGVDRSKEEDLRIGVVFPRWKDTLTCSQATIDEYDKAVKLFITWTDQQRERIHFWSDLRLEHIERYVADLQRKGCARLYIVRRIAPIKQASRWASRNWPERFRNFADGVKIPNKGDSNPTKHGAYLPLGKVGDLLVKLKEAKDLGILPGIALQGICSLRLKEAYRLRWEDIDFEGGIITVRAEKNRFSVRRIPIPAMVHCILSETPREGERVLSGFSDWRNYGKGIGRRLRRFPPAANVEPKGLRRTLPSEAWQAGWYGDTLQVYRGHSPAKASTIDWNHYIVVEPEKLIDLFREQVVARIDEALKDSLEAYRSIGQQKGSNDKVVELRQAV